VAYARTPGLDVRVRAVHRRRPDRRGAVVPGKKYEAEKSWPAILKRNVITQLRIVQVSAPGA
jgi:hypothetical protein